MTLNISYSPTLSQVTAGQRTSFPFDFMPISKDYIAVWVKKPNNFRFYKQFGGWSIVDDAKIEFTEPLEVGSYVLVARETPIYQPTPYQTSSGFQAKVIENSFDRLTANVQEVAYKVTRSVVIPEGSDVHPGSAWESFLNMWNDVKAMRAEVQTMKFEVKALKQEVEALKQDIVASNQTAIDEIEALKQKTLQDINALKTVTVEEIGALKQDAIEDVDALKQDTTGLVENARTWAVGTITEQPAGSAKYWANKTHEELYNEPIEIADEILTPSEPSEEPSDGSIDLGGLAGKDEGKTDSE
jgi:hypothetical protein